MPHRRDMHDVHQISLPISISMYVCEWTQINKISFLISQEMRFFVSAIKTNITRDNDVFRYKLRRRVADDTTK